jgi:hypothetical protein
MGLEEKSEEFEKLALAGAV